MIWTNGLPQLSGLPHLCGPPQLSGNRPLDCSLVRLTRHLNPRIFACRMWNPFCHLFPFISSTLIVLFDRNSNNQRTMFLFSFFFFFFFFFAEDNQRLSQSFCLVESLVSVVTSSFAFSLRERSSHLQRFPEAD